MSKRKLLLADDSVTIQKVVNLTFADEGIEVTAVGDGDAAMLKFVESMPDLVMVDVNMPGIDGYRICEMIKQDDETKHIPVILLVGSFEPFDEAEARRVGADDFLTKPFQSIRQLVNKVNDLLNRQTEDEDFPFLNEMKTETADSFDDISEMESATEINVVESAVTLGDAGMDDEMIHTSQFDDVPTEEKNEYESEPLSEYESLYESFAEDIDEDEEADDSEIPMTESVTDSVEPETFSIEKNEPATISADKKLFLPPLDFDNFDLLEFPKAKSKTVSEKTDLPVDSKIAGDEFGQSGSAKTKFSGANENAAVSTRTTENNQNSLQPQSLSPELIEAIADRVAEKFSTEVIKKIVREAIAQTEKKA